MNSLTNKEISLVVDPVLLMTEDEWGCVARVPKINGKYILCYLLGDSIENRKAVKNLLRR